jgi:catechol 2,3-dioxygenase-like lactoylglutathione lyase family enzyme
LSAITHLFAGVPVSDLDTSIDWYTRFFGRPPDNHLGDEVLWEIDEHAWLLIEPNTARAGAGRITLAVAGLDALLERLAAQGIRARTDRDVLQRRPPRERPRSGRERDRVRRTAGRRERVTSIGRNHGFAIDD